MGAVFRKEYSFLFLGGNEGRVCWVMEEFMRYGRMEAVRYGQDGQAGK